KVQIYNDLPTALAPIPLSLGFSRRTGQFRRQDLTLPHVGEFLSQQGHSNIALVFGNEQTGLSAAELRCTTLCVSIDTHPAQPSLNLSHAVAIVLQQLFQANITETDSQLEDKVAGCSLEFMRFLDDIHYFKDSSRRELFQDYLEKILTRGISDTSDALVVQKLLTIIRGTVKRLRSK
ncbi:MAG: TrmH family RNA methyltransferase, partial [Brevinema sp.]